MNGSEFKSLLSLHKSLAKDGCKDVETKDAKTQQCLYNLEDLVLYPIRSLPLLHHDKG
jgi:hypothetical protein